jgi:cytochrome c553
MRWIWGGFVALFTAAAVAANLDIGEEINEVCAGCHGEYAEGGKDGEYPRLAGLPVQYIERELRLFKSQERLNHPMVPYTKERELPEEDLIDVSAYIATIRLYASMPPIDKENYNAYERLLLSKKLLNIRRIDGDYEAGGQLYNRECASCHGRDGEGKLEKQIPLLAGQYTNYLLKQIDAYRSGARMHDNEAPAESIFREYSASELHNLLAYLSILDDD